ncbi:MAG: LytR C-terminal domain-containing protein [bacterium]
MPKKLDSLSARKTPASTPAASPAVEKETKAPVVEVVAPSSTPAPIKEELPATADTFESMFPEPTVSISRPPVWLIWVFLLIASLLAAGAGFAYFNPQLDSWLSPGSTPAPTLKPTATPVSSPTPTVTATPTATPTASSTATPTATLRVLNGTTKSGAAASAASVLVKAGYSVRTTGNAKQRTYTSTYVYYKTGYQVQAALIQKALTGYDAQLQESTSLAAPDMILVVVAK